MIKKIEEKCDKKNYIKESNYIIHLLKKNKILKKNILELGLGTGNHAKYLIKKNYHVVGVEKSSNMLKLAKKIFGKWLKK